MTTQDFVTPQALKKNTRAGEDKHLTKHTDVIN